MNIFFVTLQADSLFTIVLERKKSLWRRLSGK